MKDKISFWDKNLMIKMFLNYLLLILIPFLFFSVLFVNLSSENMRKSAIEANMRMLDNIRSSVDEKLLSVHNLLYQLIRTKEIINTVNINHNGTPSDIYLESKCMDVFTTVLSLNPICDEIFLYTPNNESVITTTYKFYINAANNFSTSTRENMASLLSILNQQPPGNNISSFYFRDSLGNIRLASYLPVKTSPNNTVFLGVIINRNELLNILKDAKLTQDIDFIILNKEDDLLAGTSIDSSAYNSYLSAFMDTSIGNHLSPEGYLQLPEDNILTYSTTKLLSLKIASVIPVNKTSILTRKVILIMVTMFLLLIFDCIILNYYIAKRIYRPLAAILEFIFRSSHHGDINNTNVDSDVSIIRNTLKTSIEKTVELEDCINNNIHFLYEKFLLGLITETSHDLIYLTEKNKALQLKFPHKWFLIHIFHIYNYDLYKSKHGNNQAQLACNRLLQLLKDAEEPDAVFIYAINGNNIIKLTNVSDNFKEEKGEIDCNEMDIGIKHKLRDEFDLEYHSVTGMYVDNIADVPKSYLAAVDALKISFVSELESIIRVHSNDTQYENRVDEYGYNYLFRDEDIITDMLVCGKSEAAIKYMRLIIEKNLNCGTNYEYIMLLLTQLLTTAVRSVYESGYTLSDVYGYEYNIFSNFNLYDKPADIVRFIENEYSVIGKFMKSRMESYAVTHYDLAKYISDNYTKNISLSDAAEHFGLSVPYFSKFFKSTMKCLFVDYLCQYRIRKALKLIKNSNLALTQIATDIGFISYKTFSRSFKKVTSMTPEQYRTGG